MKVADEDTSMRDYHSNEWWEREIERKLADDCNRVKGTRGKDGYRLKMAELRADNVATGVMLDERQAVLTGRRLAQYHRERPEQ